MDGWLVALVSCPLIRNRRKKEGRKREDSIEGHLELSKDT